MSTKPPRLDGLARAQAAAPLVLAAALAGFSWWLVASSPDAQDATRSAAPDQGLPDYELASARVARFDAQGRLDTVLDGARMRHYPATQTVQVDAMQLAMRHPDGRRVLAQAQQGQWSEGQGLASLVGQADVRLADAEGAMDLSAPQEPGVTRILGERLDLDTRARVLSSRQPVTVLRQGSEVHAQTLRHDEPAGLSEMGGRVRGRLLATPR